MNKFVLLLSISIFSSTLFSQNIILSEDFQADSFPNILVSPIASGEMGDEFFYNIDGDENSDGSGSDRPGEWFLSIPYATSDLLLQSGDTNFVLGSNSWCDCPITNLNYFILPAIHLNDSTGILRWKSAPRQTPRFLDGYRVVISTGTNEHTDQFVDTIFKASEFISQEELVNDSGFSNFTFSSGDFIHGEDGTFIEYDNDSIRFIGKLRPFEISLAEYAGLDIYIAFLHETNDDNLISIDDVIVEGNGYLAYTSSVEEFKGNEGLKLSPNPANDYLKVDFWMNNTAFVSGKVLDLQGKIVYEIIPATRVKGGHSVSINTSGFVNGSYILQLKTGGGSVLSRQFSVLH